MNRRTFLTLGISGTAACFMGVYPVFIERYIVLINTYRIPVPRLPKSFDGFTIVHLTDLHYGFLVPLSLIQGVIGRANGIPRDIVVCTGDYVHKKYSANQIDTVWPVLARLSAPSGVFSVLGNHDHKLASALAANKDSLLRDAKQMMAQEMAQTSLFE